MQIVFSFWMHFDNILVEMFLGPDNHSGFPTKPLMFVEYLISMLPFDSLITQKKFSDYNDKSLKFAR